MIQFQLFVSYSQLAVFDSSLQKPFNNWTPARVSQGFDWRPGSVSFKTLSEADKYDIELLTGVTELPVLPSAVRVIEVPFQVPSSGLIGVASISEGHRVELEPGSCGLRFEALPGRQIRLVFISSNERQFRILRADPGLTPAFPLLVTAESA